MVENMLHKLLGIAIDCQVLQEVSVRLLRGSAEALPSECSQARLACVEEKVVIWEELRGQHVLEPKRVLYTLYRFALPLKIASRRRISRMVLAILADRRWPRAITLALRVVGCNPVTILELWGERMKWSELI